SGETTGLSRRIRRKSESWISAKTISLFPSPGKGILTGSGGGVHDDARPEAGEDLARGDHQAARRSGPRAGQRAESSILLQQGYQHVPADVDQEEPVQRQEEAEGEASEAAGRPGEIAADQAREREPAQRQRQEEEQEREGERRARPLGARRGVRQQERSHRGQEERRGQEDRQREGPNARRRPGAAP